MQSNDLPRDALLSLQADIGDYRRRNARRRQDERGAAMAGTR
jgi:hypothetical protein